VTVKQTATVDWLGLEKATGSIVLTIVDDLDWADETDHLLALQEKLNTYLAFIESDEVFDRLLDTVGRQVPRDTSIKVSILAEYPITSRAEAFLEHATGAFEGAGFTLVHKIVMSGPDQDKPGDPTQDKPRKGNGEV